MKKLLLLAAAGLSVAAAPIAASAQPFGGHFDRGYAQRGYYGYRRGNSGAVLAAGLFGLVLGAAIDNAANAQPVAYGPGYYGPPCVWQTQAYRNAWGQLEYQQVQVCR